MQNQCIEKKTWLPSLIVGLCGLALCIFSWIDYSPLESIAKRFSSDGLLSKEYTSRLAQSQWILAILLLVTSPGLAWINRCVESFHNKLIHLTFKKFYTFIGLWTFLLTYLVQAFLFDNIPHVTDACTHIFQAKLLCLGKLSAQAPPCYEHFYQFNTLVTKNGKWFSFYPPGHALILAAAMKVHSLQLIGPFAAAITILCTTWLIERCYKKTIARWFGITLSLSPLFLLLGASYMSHTTFMMCASAAGLLAVQAYDNRHRKRIYYPVMFSSGMLLGLAALVRPQDFLLLAPTFFLTLAFVPSSVRKACWKHLPGGILGLIIPTFFYGLWNWKLYGTFFAMSYGQEQVGNLTPLLIPYFGFSETFTWSTAFQQGVWTVTRLDSALIGWPSSLLWIPFVLLIRPPNRWDRLCIITVTIIFAFFFFYFYYGFEYEARFHILALPFIIVLILRGIQQCLKTTFTALRQLTRYVLFVFTLYGLFYYWPHYLIPTYAGDYEQTTPIIHKLAEKQKLQDALVLIDVSGEQTFRYSSGFIWNDPMLKNKVIYARDLGEKNACLEQAFPARKIYRFIANDTWTSGSFEKVNPSFPIRNGE